MPLPVPLLAVLLFATAAAVDSSDLATFLRAADENAAPPAPVRADGTVVCDTLEGKKEDQIAIVLRPNKDVYLELRNSGLRAIVKGDGAAAQIAEKGSAAADFAQDQLFGATDFSREDLMPFEASRYDSPIIVYRDASQMVIQLNPLKSQYSLNVITFDPAKKARSKTLCYKDTLNNLLKMRLDSDHQQVAERWLPGTVSMETFALKTKTTLKLKWSPAGDGAENLFAPGALSKPSSLTWPTQ